MNTPQNLQNIVEDLNDDYFEYTGDDKTSPFEFSMVSRNLYGILFFNKLLWDSESKDYDPEGEEIKVTKDYIFEQARKIVSKLEDFSCIYMAEKVDNEPIEILPRWDN
jgi:hypothetical protein